MFLRLALSCALLATTVTAVTAPFEASAEVIAAPPEVALEIPASALGMNDSDEQDAGPALVVGTRQLPQ